MLTEHPPLSRRSQRNCLQLPYKLLSYTFTVNKNWSPTCSQPLKGTRCPIHALLLNACQVTFQREETDVVKPLAPANSRKLLGVYIYSLPFHSTEAEMTRCDLTKSMMPHLVLQHFSWALLKPGFAGISTTTLWNLIRDLFEFNIYTFLNVYRHLLSLISNCSPFLLLLTLLLIISS